MAALGRDCRLIIFTRYPEPGTTKTRLIPVLGPEGAADLHRRMTLHALEWAAELKRREGVEIEVRFTGGDAQKMATMFGGGVRYVPQGEGDLGQRLECAFIEALRDGPRRTIAIGADCPGVTADVMRKALLNLRYSDLVVGPASDGGYYLIGLKDAALAYGLFSGIEWGTEHVLEQTLAAARGVHARVSVLKRLDDVDRPEDLPVWEAARHNLAPPGLRGRGRVAVIIPTLNEVEHLPRTLERLLGLENVQVIVADGGSSDGTTELARSHGATVVQCAPGRGVQMNAGAAEAVNADVLLFCHADTLLPVGFGRRARATLADPDVIAGAFTLRIDGGAAGLRRVERAVAWRCQYLHMPYGDQALFLRAGTFHELGGFAPLPQMEDYQLVRRLRRRGRIIILDEPVITSGRAWRTAGVLRATLMNQIVIAGYHIGVRPATLARFRRWALSR